MELLRITRQIHCKAVEQRATLIHRQYNLDWGTSYSRSPIYRSIPHFPPCYKILAVPLCRRMCWAYRSALKTRELIEILFGADWCGHRKHVLDGVHIGAT